LGLIPLTLDFTFYFKIGLQMKDPVIKPGQNFVFKEPLLEAHILAWN